METVHPPTARLLVTGERACFRRPECSSDLVTYDVMPPPIARRLLATMFGDEGWRLTRIVVGRPIRFVWDELVTARGSKRVLALDDVAYILEARFLDRWSVPAVGARRSVHLGLSDYPASIRLLDPDEPTRSSLCESGAVDLGWMIYDTDRSRPRFFRASMIAGVIDVNDDGLVLVS